MSPLVSPLLFSFQQAREDLRQAVAGLTTAQLWASPHGFASVGFHVRHIAGSVDRLTTYLQGRPLNPGQMATLAAEHSPANARPEELLALVEDAFRNAEALVRTIDVSALPDLRAVGRKHLPTTVIGLLVHIAEHTQRHVGQAISAAKLARI
ncbi:MAG TPA: DinB family protein [Bryobacteraceae bacterium]|nr:DinB family protein [Bryobacteraceae bacterium]